MAQSELVDVSEEAVSAVEELEQEIEDLRRELHARNKELSDITRVKTDRSNLDFIPFFKALLCMSLAHAYKKLGQGSNDDDVHARGDYLDSLKIIDSDAFSPRREHKEAKESMLALMRKFPSDMLFKIGGMARQRKMLSKNSNAA